MKRKNKIRKTEEDRYKDANDLTKISTPRLEKQLGKFNKSLERVTTGDLIEINTNSTFPNFLMLNIAKMKTELASRIGKNKGD